MAVQKQGRIAMIVDERLSREKGAILTRHINALRTFADIQLIAGSIAEPDLLKRLETESFQLILAPWYRYLTWSKIEAFYGLTRTSGPTFAGYHCEPLLPYELGEQADHLRAILLDFGGTSTPEVCALIRALLLPAKRFGIQPLLKPNTPIYCENWHASQGIGFRLDAVLGLPEISGQSVEWRNRSAAIRIVLTALWSLVYEEGPGKVELAQGSASKTPRAAFQLAADEGILVFRLCFQMPAWSPKDALAAFWPDLKRPTSPMQLLLRFCDFVRVHSVADTTMQEVVVGFLNSAPAEKSHAHIHTLWVEPIAETLVTEMPFELPGAAAPRLRLLPITAPTISRPTPTNEPSAEDRARERHLAEAATNIRELKEAVAAREAQIRELRSGGVGTAAPPPPPDTESLLEAFQERYFEARYQIRQFETQIAEIEKRGATDEEILTLRKKMDALANRETAWIKKLVQTIEHYRDAKGRK